MYFHPLQEEIGNLSDEEISKRIKDLSRKVNTARMAIRDRRIDEWHKNNKKLRGEPDLGDLVNID